MGDPTTNELLAHVVALRAELAEIKERLVQREQVFVGWKEIASYLRYSEDHAKALGQDPIDPIPYFLQGGFACVRRTELDAWSARRRRPGPRKGRRGTHRDGRSS